MLKGELTSAEKEAQHLLHGYDAQDAKDELETQLKFYCLIERPFTYSLGQEETVLDFWKCHAKQPSLFILAVGAQRKQWQKKH